MRPRSSYFRLRTQGSTELQSAISEFDLYLLAEGTHYRAYEKLGAHITEKEGKRGVQFAVWAPNAKRVSIIGDFNNWHPNSSIMRPSTAGIWEGFVPDIAQGASYKYHIESRYRDYKVDKADPYGFAAEIRPNTAARVWNLENYSWHDDSWMKNRTNTNSLGAALSFYEVHLGSWKRALDENNRWLTYRELAPLLADYVHDVGFTHVEFLPVMEHPFDGSWGYETLGYFAPTSRFGTPDDFMYLVDYLHQRGIGVVLDWVPAHFPKDEAGLGYFDGSHLYEHADPRQGEHPDWNTFVFNYGRSEVKTFLISNALFWFDKYHIDGLRVDAVASMLYLDYGRREGQWIPNRYGGKENVDALDFLRRGKTEGYGALPDAMTIAEESTAWPMVSRPAHLGGLGFGLKWNMGWMHDTLDYMSKDPVYRRHHHGSILFGLHYAFSENFILPLSHDEVVHGKRSILGRMPGDQWQRFANLRAYYAFMFGHPGKKLMFMGCEFAQEREWNHDHSLDWHLLDESRHAGIQSLVRDLNRLYRAVPALHQRDCEESGFEWLITDDSGHNVFAWLRKGNEDRAVCVVVVNFSPNVYYNYRVRVPLGGKWYEVFNSDSAHY